jgi:antitoxin ParD1/3/4
MRQLDRRCYQGRWIGFLGQPIFIGMNVPLTPEQIAWLEGKVAAGHFSSLEEAAAAAISDTIASEVDDLSWAKPLVNEARASVERGEFLTHDQFKHFIAEERRKLG